MFKNIPSYRLYEQFIMTTLDLLQIAFLYAWSVARLILNVHNQVWLQLFQLENGIFPLSSKGTINMAVPFLMSKWAIVKKDPLKR